MRMWTWRGATVGTLTATLVIGGAVVLTAPADAVTVTVKLRSAIKTLPVASETHSGYNRDKFKYWVDADRDCRNTRAEVLRAESKKAVTGKCAVRTGKWKSYYDGATWTRASDVDIDHMVPLAEAWDSGARKWDAARRQAYANDLGDARTLVAVTDNVKRSKGNRDPAQWLPNNGRCRYVREWVAVKVRWSLTVDRAEKKALSRTASTCKNVTIKVVRAPASPPNVVTPCPTPVPTVVPTPQPTPTPTPMPTATPVATPSEPTPAPAMAGTVYSAAAVCGPTPTPTPSVYFKNCDEVREAGKAPLLRGQPGYRSGLDGDNDGKACES